MGGIINFILIMLFFMISIIPQLLIILVSMWILMLIIIPIMANMGFLIIAIPIGIISAFVSPWNIHNLTIEYTNTTIKYN